MSSWSRAAVFAVLFAGCAHTREDGAPPPAPPDRPSVARAASGDGRRDQPGRATPVADGATADADSAPEQRVEVRYDLVAFAHTAEIAQNGLVIDLGSPSAVRHTLGGWRTGWGRDRQDGDVSYAALQGSRTRLYFGADAPAAGRVRVRGKGGSLRLTLNDEPLGSIDLAGAGWRAGEIEFPARALHAGENSLFLSGRDIRVDRVEIRPSAAEGAPDAPLAADLVTRAELGSAEVAALRLSGGTTLSYTLQVPEHASLRMALAATSSGAGATVRVAVARDGAAPASLLEAPVSAGAPVERHADLSAYAGEVVRIDLGADGAASTQALVVAPRVVVPSAASGSEGAAARRAPAKNVMIVLVDTLRADKLRPYNPASRVATRSFERLAHDGTLFENAAPQENWTKPSVATLLTGLYPSSHNTKTDSAVLPSQADTLGEMLQQAGFTTAAFIANGYVSDRFGFNQGWNQYRNYVREERANKAEILARDVNEWIDRRDPSRRFFLYVHAIDPHVPYTPPLEYIHRYDPSNYSGPIRAARTAMLLEDIKTGRFDPSPRDRARLEALYDGEVSYNDEHLEAIFDHLAEKGLLDDTLVVFTSDHGEEFFDHGSVGHGHSLYRELVHVPLVMRLPGRIAAGARITEDVGLVDVVPTVLDLLGVPVPPATQGRSVVGLIDGHGYDAPRGALSEFLDTQRSVISGRYKLLLRGTMPVLFDLSSDPHELHDVAAERPIVLRHMRGLLGALVAGADVALGSTPQRPRRVFARENTTIDPETEAQLRALGYVGTSRPR